MFSRFFAGEGHRGGCRPHSPWAGDFEGRGPGRGHEARGFGGRGEGRGPWGRGGFGHGGGRERLFDSGELALVILKLLAERPSYGYELIKAIEERFAGGYAPSPGVVYPTLTMLEERGLAQVQSSEGNRKVYAVTEAGQAELAANKARLDAIFDRIEHSSKRFGRERSPEIMRAFRNLGEAIRARMIRGEAFTAEQVSKIAAAINEAARVIDTL
jgi:DNA-binding PadR family transcriptional regulator